MIGGYSSLQLKTSVIHRGYAASDNLKNILMPLIDIFTYYDRMRITLEEKETDFHFWEKMTEVLSKRITIRTDCGWYDVKLKHPVSVKKAVRCIHYDLHVEIRQRSNLLPVYYLCRTKCDYWSEYGLIVEDLYASPGYPFHDERLVKLMQNNHEVYYLRLAQMRNEASAMFKGIESGSLLSHRTDELLYEVGRYVFQAIWHEDQKPALAACSAFGIERFRQAMELLYLCLSGDLCNLRGVLTEQVFQFFTCVYPQPALVALLRMIQEADGATLAALPQRVKPLYFRLSRAFGSFLKKDVTWKNGRNPVPLYKILFGNLSRLELLPAMLKDNGDVNEAVAKIGKESDVIIDKILDKNSSNLSNS
jgi:hypothetical protein